MRNALNFIAFYGVQSASVYGAAHHFFWAGPISLSLALILCIYLSSKKQVDLLLALLSVIIGYLVELALLKAGLIVYLGYEPGSVFVPLWVLGLWINFALTITHSLSWLKNRYLLSSILGAIFGPFSYAIGIRMGAATVNNGFNFLILESIVWAIVVPMLYFCAEKLDT